MRMDTAAAALLLVKKRKILDCPKMRRVGSLSLVTVKKRVQS